MESKYYQTKTPGDMPSIVRKSIDLTTIRLSDAQLVGSYSQAALPFWSDIDINDKARITYEDLAADLKRKARKLSTDGVVHFSDFKAGDDHFSLKELLGMSESKLTSILKKGGTIKLDVIFYYDSRFIEQTSFFVINPPTRSEKPNLPTRTLAALQRLIAEDGLEFLEQGDSLKAIKRAWSIARMNRDTASLDKMHPLLLSDIQRLSVIKSDIATTLLALQKFPSKDVYDETTGELDVFKDEIASMATNVSQRTRERLIAEINAIEGREQDHLEEGLEELLEDVTKAIRKEFDASPFAPLQSWAKRYLERHA